MSLTDVYLFTASLGFVFTVVGAVAGHMGGGHAAPHDVAGNFEAGHGGHIVGHGDAHGGDQHDAPGLPLLSPSVISCYVGCFGASGLIYQWLFGADHPEIHAPLAGLTGLGLGFGVAFAIWKVTSTFEANKLAKESDALNALAEVATTVPKEGMGEIAYVSGKTRQTLPAKTADGLEHKPGAAVKVVRVVEGVAHVQAAPAIGEVGRGEPVRNKAS